MEGSASNNKHARSIVDRRLSMSPCSQSPGADANVSLSHARLLVFEPLVERAHVGGDRPGQAVWQDAPIDLANGRDATERPGHKRFVPSVHVRQCEVS